MPRPEDIAWKFVVRLDGKRWRCPYCHKKSTGSVTRVKSHFLRQAKEGIAHCTKVPEHVRTLMELLLNHEVRNKEDIAWKFVNRLEDSKWRCYYCSGEFFKDLTGVKGHLLGVPNEGISICTQVPDHVRKIMQSLQDEMAEEESRGANGQSSAEPQSRGMPAQAEVAEEESREVAEEQSREAHGQSSIESNSRDMPSQAEVAEEESREANRQFSTEPQSRDMLSPAVPRSSQSSEDIENLFTTAEGATDMENLDYNQERHFHETLAMPPPAQNIHEESREVAEEQSREAHGQSSVEPKSRDMPTHSQQAGVAEEEIRGANCQLSTEPESRDMPPPAVLLSPLLSPPLTPQSWELVKHLFLTPGGELQETLPMQSPAQNSHGDSTSCSADALAEELSYLLASSHQPQCSFLSPCTVEMPMNGQQTPMGASSSQDNRSTSVDMNRGSPIMNVRRTPQTCRRIEQMVQEAWPVDIANLPSDGATSYSSASSLPNSFFPNSLTLNAQQNPSALLPLQNRQLLDNTSQNESQRSMLSGLDASDALLTNMVTTNTPQHFNHSDQTFHGQCGRGTGLSPPQVSMDIEPPIPSQPFNGPPFTGPFNSPPQVPGDIINTTGPSTSAVQPDLVPPQHQNVPHQSETRNVLQNPTAPSSQAPNNAPPGATEISNFNQLDIIGLNADQQSQAERESSSMALAEAESYLHYLPDQCSIQSQMPMNYQQIPAGESSFQYDTGNSHCLQGRNQHSQLQTPMDIDASSASRHASDPPIVEATVDDSQVPKVATNTTGPSSSQDMNRCSPTMNLRSIYADDKMIRNLKRKVEELDDKEAVIKEQMEIESAASSVRKKPRILVERWLKETKRARNNVQIIGQANAETLPPKEQLETLTREVEELIGKTLPQTLLIEERDAKGVKLLERKLTGEAIHRNIELIWDHLTKNHGCKFGIYGMGGVGKTTIMMHIHNRLLEDATFDGVVFITVSKDFSIYKLQSDIGKALKCGVIEDEDEDEKKRAAILSEHLERKKNCVLMLDDVWERLDLEEVGIPVRADGCKLVLTSRSYSVCCQMQCQEQIKIKPLSQKEAESLFWEELGSEVQLNLETKAIVKSIVEKCAGLPIGVITMARSMRGVTDVFEWRDSLVKLEESSKGQTDMEKVLMNLKFSYDRLGNSNVQQCFLSCALYPEDRLIDKFELVEFFIDQGLIGGLNTRREQCDRGLTILNKLGNVCLLEDHRSMMKMHDLIRDMALHIMSATSIVKAGKRLTMNSFEEYWTDALEKVSLMENAISEFPLDMSPNCPKLSILLLNKCWWRNVAIPDSFFKNLLGLKVLNLSGCAITELPNSISELVNLRALLLRKCWSLCHIPYLGKLTSLRKLDVYGCFELKEVPEGLEMLVNLRYLDLRLSLTAELPERVLGGLLNLQHLKVYFVDGQDMTKLRALETLKCSFKDANSFNKYVRVIEQSNPGCYYHLDYYFDYCPDVVQEFINNYEEESDITQFENPKRKVDIWGWDHAIVSVGGECTGIFILIPQDVQKMTIYCNGITNLSSIGPLEYLEELYIEGSENLGVLYGGEDKEVIDIFVPALAPLLFSSLRVLKIWDCPKLKYLFGHGSKFVLPHLREIEIEGCKETVGIIAAVTSPPPNPLPFFPSLEQISIRHCNKMKRAVESEWMPHFPNLRRITAIHCVKMEEIIGGPPPYSPDEQISLESLCVFNCNNMRKLLPHELLLHLRNLQSIEVAGCKGMVELISGARQGQEESLTAPVNSAPSSFQPPISLPKLEQLNLQHLPQLKSICEVPISCDSMKKLTVSECPELTRIPLQLRFREIEELPHIRVKDEEKWKTLMWDHPDAQAILRPYLQKREHDIVLEISQDSALEESPTA